VNDPLISKHAEEIRSLARRHGAMRVRIFGSRATGAAVESSDLDLLVDFEPGRDLLDLVGLKQDLEALLGVGVDILTERALSPYLRDQVLAAATPL